MIRRLFLVAAAVAWLVAPGGPEAREWKKIRIGVEGAYPPFSWINPQGKLEGFDIDIAYALCAKIGAECELVLQDWDGMIPALLAKKFDAIVASMSITEERKKKVDFTDKYYQTPARFVRKKGSGIEITREGLKGKKIGVQRATIHDNYLTDNYGDTVEIVRYGTQDEANLDMIAGRLDLLLADSIALLEGLLKTEKGKDFEFVGPELRDPRWFGEGAGIAVRKEDQDLKKLLNEAIKAIRADGTYDAIARKYFDFDIYGG
ncbi:MAG: ABC transporter substrate-binding protein [Geminicoccaceae bacterium]|nr:ABC transporter substrate-binding protein [Geminicoccaceae bacterium]MCX7630928.1 ABC transporter substrate-binding protein [Geminicoccaceae bacterium]MDW8123948.1 ABC transporter substrate-binding protein [Geminicoccaceae bacterium]MDW8339990.1 ABC transporter substrate-binding protein [Geminicoccaceae bacterium]